MILQCDQSAPAAFRMEYHGTSRNSGPAAANPADGRGLERFRSDNSDWLPDYALYEALAQDGWMLEAHIGKELQVLQLFMQGAFRGLSPLLENRTFIELKTKSSRIRGAT